jgi:hypothetical protein
VIAPFWATGSVIGIGALNGAFAGAAGADAAVLFIGVGACAGAFVFGTFQTRQTNFLPSLLHTYLVPGVSIKAPTFLQELPILGAAAASATGKAKVEASRTKQTVSENLRIGSTFRVIGHFNFAISLSSSFAMWVLPKRVG